MPVAQAPTTQPVAFDTGEDPYVYVSNSAGELSASQRANAWTFTITAEASITLSRRAAELNFAATCVSFEALQHVELGLRQGRLGRC